jgi:hypothetical protein
MEASHRRDRSGVPVAASIRRASRSPLRSIREATLVRRSPPRTAPPPAERPPQLFEALVADIERRLAESPICLALLGLAWRCGE